MRYISRPIKGVFRKITPCLLLFKLSVVFDALLQLKLFSGRSLKKHLGPIRGVQRDRATGSAFP